MALFGNKKTTKDEDQKEEKKTSAKSVKVVKEVKKEVATKTSSSASSMKDLYSEKEENKSRGSKLNTKRRPGGKILSSRTLVKPLVTEKAANLAESGKYAFIVSINANKIEVAKAVSDVYGVEVESVNIIRMKGKAVSRGRIRGSRSDFKKAVVTLKKGQTIQIYEGV